MNEAISHAVLPASDPLARAIGLLGEVALEVETLLDETIRSTVEMIPEVSRHLTGSGGKRIRPVLLLLFEKALGKTGAPLKGGPLAAATELFHTATLLHDDVVDCGQLRRGVPSAPRVYGNSASVLVGDFLFAKAFGIVTDHNDPFLLQELNRVLASMAEGEVMQLIRAGRGTIAVPEYVRIISGKTAGLFSWCCRAGASLSEAEPPVVKEAAAFGSDFGMAFQIVDDILDYTATPDESGKDLANDLLHGKTTLPLLLACEHDTGLLDLLEATQRAAPDEKHCREIHQRVLSSHALAQAGEHARCFSEKAVSHLERFPPGPTAQALSDLARHVVDRISSSP
jgi:octaprenyl-diphosphate synthase